MTSRSLNYPVERLQLYQKVIRSALRAYQGGYPTSHMRLYPLLSATFVPLCRDRLDVFSARTSFGNQTSLSSSSFDFVESCSQEDVAVLKVDSRSFLNR